MTFTSRSPAAPKAVRIQAIKAQQPLLVRGQGVFFFKAAPETAALAFRILDASGVSGLRISYDLSGLKVFEEPSGIPLIDAKAKGGLTTAAGAYYWFSIDSQNQRLRAGVGEARLETMAYEFTLKQSDLLGMNPMKHFLESLTQLTWEHPLIPLKLVRDPVVAATPLKVKDTQSITMGDIASGNCMPKANLSPVAQQLYECIAGPKFVLDDPSFPDFSKAIEYSIATPGCWCHETLKAKANEFSKEKPNLAETYLRITLGGNNGESPGVPYVMEIWPVGHYSPVHNHAGANAVIRVLHGAIHVSLFPFLSSDPDGVKPFGEADFVKGDITWISPALNQVHQLKNLEGNRDTCITIQCYMYDGDDAKHYDFFDYRNDTGTVEQYEPDSDMEFTAFKELMRKEWKARRRWC